MTHRVLAIALLSSLLGVTSFAQNDFLDRWNRPVEPFRIIDNIYYVGSNEIASYLIVGEEGHVIIDGGFVETAPIIMKSVAKLGFDIEDVEILLNTHAHFDHSAGLAALKAASGAELYVHERDADITERGGKDDYLLGNEGLFPAVTVDKRLKDGEEVQLGNIKLTANLTAGHTKGCTTWTMQAMDNGVLQDVVLVCSVSVLPRMRLLTEPSYPGIADDFQRTFEVLESLPCDVFLAPHGQFIDLLGKMELLAEAPEQNPFIDPNRYKDYVKRGKKRFMDRLEEERQAGN